MPDDRDKLPWPVWRLLDMGNPEHNLYAAEKTRLPAHSLPRPHQLRVISIGHKLSVRGGGAPLTETDVKPTIENIWECLSRAHVGRNLCHRNGCKPDIICDKGWPTTNYLVVPFFGLLVGQRGIAT
jgi:hypothetical protein